MVNCGPMDSLMDPDQKLMAEQIDLFSDPERYKRLVGKFIHLTVTRLDLSFAFVVSTKFMWALRLDEWIIVIHILRYLKEAP